MATTVYARLTRTTLAGQDPLAYDVSATAPSALASRWMNFVPMDGGERIASRTITSSAKASGDRRADPFVQMGLYSDRVAAEVTVTADIQVKHYNRIFLTMDPFKVSFRFELTKIASSGMVETPIGAVTEPAPISGENGSALYTATLPVPTPVTLYPNERLILRCFLDPAPGQTMIGDPAGAAIGLAWGNITSQPSQIQLVFAETLTFTANVTPMYARRTAVNAIGNFFDLLTTVPTQTAATGVVNSPGSGTGEQQWTRTAGGINLEFISPRFKNPYYFSTPDPTTVPAASTFAARESATTANLAPRFKLFHYRNGVETLIHMNTALAEMITSNTDINLAGYTAGANFFLQQMAFKPDDRLILRLYITNVGGNFGAGTGTINYDEGTAKGFVRLYDLPVDPFKAEGDPAEAPIVPDGVKTMGMGNG